MNAYPRIAKSRAFDQDTKRIGPFEEVLILVAMGDFVGAKLKADTLSDSELSMITDQQGQNIITLLAKNKPLTSPKELTRLIRTKHIRKRLLIALICKIDTSYTVDDLKGSLTITLEKLAIMKAKKVLAETTNEEVLFSVVKLINLLS